MSTGRKYLNSLGAKVLPLGILPTREPTTEPLSGDRPSVLAPGIPHIVAADSDKVSQFPSNPGSIRIRFSDVDIQMLTGPTGFKPEILNDLEVFRMYFCPARTDRFAVSSREFDVILLHSVKPASLQQNNGLSGNALYPAGKTQAFRGGCLNAHLFCFDAHIFSQ